MAFSVVSTMDGSMFGSLSASKRRSPGSNRAGGREGQMKQKDATTVFFNVKIQNVSFISPQWRWKGKSHLPPTATIFSTQEVINHSVTVKSKVSPAASEGSVQKKHDD